MNSKDFVPNGLGFPAGGAAGATAAGAGDGAGAAGKGYDGKGGGLPFPRKR